MTTTTSGLRRSLTATLAVTCTLLLVAAAWNLFSLAQALSDQRKAIEGEVTLLGRSAYAKLEQGGFSPPREASLLRPDLDPGGVVFPKQVAILRFGRVDWAQPLMDPPKVPPPPSSGEVVDRSERLWVFSKFLPDDRIFMATYESPAYDRMKGRFFLQALFEVGAVGALLLFWILLGLRLYRSYSGIDESLQEAGSLISTQADASPTLAVVNIFQQTVAELKKRTAELEKLHRDERERAENVQRLAEALYTNLEAGYLLFDLEGKLSGVNAKARQLLGLVEFPRIGDEAGKLLVDRPALQKLLKEAWEARSLVTAEEIDGAPGHRLQVAALPLFNNANQLRGHLLILTDRTREYAMEQTLREREALMRLGEMSAGVAHEVRNALGSMLAYLRLMKQDHGDLEGDSHYQALNDETRALEKVVQNLLYFARPIPLKPEEIELSEFLEEIAGQLRESFPGGIFETSGEGVAVQGDHEALGRCLLNLGRNAAEAAGESKDAFTVRMAAGRQGDSGAVLVVEDDGPGIEGDPKDLFKPFETDKPGGTGLGLAIARKIAREHGGDITVKTHGDLGGAVFTLTLP